MAQHPIHKIVVSILDAKTCIELCKTQHTIIGRGGSLRAEQRAIEEAKNLVLDFWARQWWYEHYGLTAKQYDRLVADRQIDALASWHFEVSTSAFIGIADTEYGNAEKKIAL